MTLDEAIVHSKELFENQSVCEDCREEHKQLAEWLEELKQYKEENQETNLDHFQQEILEECMWNLAVVKGRPKLCSKTSCSDCDFKTSCSDCDFKGSLIGCHKRVADWLKEPYKTPAIKLAKFETDLLQSYLKSRYLSGHKFKDISTLNRMKEKGYFKCIDENEEIDYILANCEVVG